MKSVLRNDNGWQFFSKLEDILHPYPIVDWDTTNNQDIIMAIITMAIFIISLRSIIVIFNFKSNNFPFSSKQGISFDIT